MQGVQVFRAIRRGVMIEEQGRDRASALAALATDAGRAFLLLDAAVGDMG